LAEHLKRVEPYRSISVRRTAGIGAFPPFIGRSANDQNCPIQPFPDREEAKFPKSRAIC
jgi:hypothetical protein